MDGRNPVNVDVLVEAVDVVDSGAGGGRCPAIGRVGEGPGLHLPHTVVGEGGVDRGAGEVVLVRLEIAAMGPGVKHVGAVAVGDRVAPGLLVITDVGQDIGRSSNRDNDL